MENISLYVKMIFSLYVILTVIDNLITNEKYAVFIRFVCGVLMMVALINPITNIFNEKILLDNINLDKLQANELVYQSILRAQNERNDEIIACLTNEVNKKVLDVCQSYELSVHNVRVEINLDFEDEQYGCISFIRIELEQNEEINDYKLVLIKNNLANFYYINVSNIYITVREE